MIPGSGEVSSSEGTTQGDPLAMAVYAPAVRPLIDRLQSNSPSVKQVWYVPLEPPPAASFMPSGTTSLNTERALDTIRMQARPTYLVVEAQFLEEAKHLFTGTNVNITTQGKHHLGAAIGSRDYTEQYVREKVKMWIQEIHRLAEIATSQPHAAYAFFIHGLSSRWTYLQRTIPGIHNHLKMPFIRRSSPRSPAVHHAPN